jgi:purine nucleoside permease|tara:strand:- start:221 stop:445 length:225 start_codon:yes stop_codon:yes gene_type:complete
VEDKMNAEWELRWRRNALLADCDWTIMEDSPLSDDKKKEWKTYRQALRDLPANSTPKLDKNNVLTGYTFPTKPS